MIARPFVREFREADRLVLNEIHRLARPDELAGLPVEVAVIPFMEDASSQALFDQSRILVHEQSGVIQGFAGHMSNYIVWLYVHPDARGCGVARRLVSVMLDELQGQAVYLSLLANNQGARACYQRLGFSVHETFGFEYQGVSMQGLRMYRDQQTSMLNS